MKTKLQAVLANVTHEQSMRLWELVSCWVEDCETSDTEVSEGLVQLRDQMDAAMVSKG